MTTQNASTARKTLLTHLTLAGAAALAGTAANAQVTVVPVNQTIGFDLGAGDISRFTSSLPGTHQFIVITATNFGGFVHLLGLGSSNGSFYLKGGSTALNTPAGKKFSTITGPTLRGSYFQTSNLFGSFSSLNPTFPSYIAFRFAPTTPGSFDYGWIELGANTVDGGLFGGNGSITIDEYAYDLSGAQLPNGATSSVPEPSPAVALAAFSALALGAVGVRRLKALGN